jgi:hypothetical protein
MFNLFSSQFKDHFFASTMLDQSWTDETSPVQDKFLPFFTKLGSGSRPFVIIKLMVRSREILSL